MSVRPSPKLRPGIWDAVVVLAVVMLAVGSAVLVWGGEQVSGALTAVVNVDGAVADVFPLEEIEDDTHIIEANGYTLSIRVTNTEVWVESSDCPTQDCVHTGHISRSGQSIVCLPARVIITLEGTAPDGDGPDIVIG